MAFTPDDDQPADAEERPSSSPAAEAESSPADDDAEGEEGTRLTDDEIGNPRLKQLSDEAAKHRRLRREAEARVKELEEGEAAKALQEENRTLRLRLAFERATLTANFIDVDAAWKLADDDLAAVDIKDGRADTNRIGEIVNHLITRYPYLVGAEVPADERPKDAFTDEPSGRQTNGPRPSSDTASVEVLARKFPALRR